MAVLAITHEVENYDNWREIYDDNDDIREKYGIRGGRVLQETDNSNMITVLADGELEALKSFAGSTDLYEAMKASGVVGLPKTSYLEDVS